MEKRHYKPQSENRKPIVPLIKTDNGGVYKCHYCNGLFPESVITKDHKKAKSDGGANKPKNYVPSCRDCNWLKADIPYEKFRAIVAEFGTEMTRIETPFDAVNHTVMWGGVSYNLGNGKPKVSINSHIGYGSRILTTVVVKTKLYLFISKQY